MMLSKKFIPLLFHFLFFTNVQAQTKPLGAIPEIKKFQFRSIQSKTLPGLIADRELKGTINEAEKMGDLVLALCIDKTDGYIFRDGRYNNSNYLVEQGIVQDKSGKVMLPAYRIAGPSTMKKEFVANGNGVFIKFPTIEDYAIYQLTDDNVTKLVEIAGASIAAGGFTKIPALVASDFSKPVTIFYEASKKKFSIYTALSPGIEAAQLLSNPFFQVIKYRYKVDLAPFDFTVQSSPTRKFFLNKLAHDKVALVWQSSDQSKAMSSVFNADFRTHATTILNKDESAILIAAVTSPNSVSYYLTIDALNQSPSAVLYQSKPADKKPLRQLLITDKSGLNIYAYSGGYADLEFSRDTLLLMIARKMHASSDGLNHQGGIAVRFDATNLALINNFGQTSGHSFDNLITLNAQGEFIGMDLGDNYPRGVNLHTFKNYLRSQVVYTFKTQHGTTADCYGIATYPEYKEISTKEKKYYKWSNDNGTYTELGGIVETGDGYLVSFCGEPDEKGLSLDNRKSEMDMPRNVGFVKVVKNFPNINSGAVNEVPSEMISSKGVSETGGFFTFGGKWSPQKNTGVVWLTNYRSPDQTARHLKTVALPNGNILLAWELWTSNIYDKTYSLIVDANGKKISDFIELGYGVRLHRRDEPLVIGKKVIFASAIQVDQMLELVVLEFKP